MIYHVFANRSNIGDWLSARAIQKLLGVPVVELLCDEPFVPETLARLADAGPSDLIVIGGGGLIMDYFSPFWRGFEAISRRVPFGIWGVGCCDMKRENSRPDHLLLELIVSRSRLCVVRDELTRSFLGRCDVGDPVACPTVTLIPWQPPGHGILHVDSLDSVGERAYEAMNAVARQFSVDTARPFNRINNEIPSDSERKLAATLEQYGRADLILTGRLHGCIIGLAMGRKVLAVSGDRKIESFMRAAGLEDWVLEANDTAVLGDRLRSLGDQRPSLAFMDAARQANRAVAQAVLELADSIRRDHARPPISRG